MGRFVLIGVLLVGLAIGPGGPRAQTADADIRAIISSQIEAFKADDFETAFSFASPTLRQMFGNPQRFGAMVQTGYPMVWRPAQVQFSRLETRGGRTVQSVIVTDGAGALHVLDYEMVAGDDGWRINGVMARRPGDAGA
jgi:hypothetical protein